MMLMSVKDVIEYPYIITGAGASEAFISRKLREWSTKLDGREQLSGEKFIEALESIPLTLAENAGMDPIDSQVQLRAKVSISSKPKYGIDVVNAKISDVSIKEIFEPLAVKEQVINAATEASSMILRIDNVIAASKSKTSSGSSHIGGNMGAGMDGSLICKKNKINIFLIGNRNKNKKELKMINILFYLLKGIEFEG